MNIDNLIMPFNPEDAKVIKWINPKHEVKRDSLESDIIALSSKLIKEEVIRDYYLPQENEQTGDILEQNEPKSKLIKLVSDSCNDTKPIEHYLIKLKTYITQMEMISDSPILSQLN